MKEKIKTVKQLASNWRFALNNSLNKAKPALTMMDAKIATLIPNPKLKKILYIGVGSLFGFMFLIIVLGLILSPLRNTTQTEETVLNKPKVIVSSPEPIEELTGKQREILDLEIKIKELRFPESILNIPMIESNLAI